MTQPPIEVVRYLSRKRGRKSARTRTRLIKRYQKATLWRQLNDLAFGRDSKIIEMLARHAKRRMPASPYGVDVHVGKQFSIIDDPKGAIDLICSFARALKEGQRIKHINFNHHRLESYDLGAERLRGLPQGSKRTSLHQSDGHH
jgi:diaminopimelate decarboxylase